MVLDKATQHCTDMVCTLLNHMSEIAVVTPEQFHKASNTTVTSVVVRLFTLKPLLITSSRIAAYRFEGSCF